MLTECSMSDNVAVALPNVDFIRPCNLCPHMKRITLKKILRALEHMEYPVEVEAEVADRARPFRSAYAGAGPRRRSMSGAQTANPLPLYPYNTKHW